MDSHTSCKTCVSPVQVREQQHHIRELEKAAAELKELVAASKSETATVRQQMARNTKMADKKMQVASDAARAHADSLAKEVCFRTLQLVPLPAPASPLRSWGSWTEKRATLSAVGRSGALACLTHRSRLTRTECMSVPTTMRVHMTTTVHTWLHQEIYLEGELWIFLQLEDAENQILIIQAECKQAKEQTEVVRCELYKVQQLHTAAHEIIQALQQKEAAKKSRMVAEHAFSVSYNPHQ